MRSRKQSGFLQFVLGCGCVMVILAVVGVAAGFWYFWARKPAPPPAQTDSGQVKALSEQILPGIETPPGHVGFLCQTTGTEQLAYLGPAGLGRDSALQANQLLFMMDSFPAGQVAQPQAETQLQETLVQQGWVLGKTGKVLEQQDATVKVGGAPAHATKRLIDGTPRLFQYSLLLENSQGRTVVLVVEGPQDTFNTPALESALAKVQARPLGTPAAVAPSTPTPVATETPANEETPEATPAQAPHTPGPGGKKPH